MIITFFGDQYQFIQEKITYQKRTKKQKRRFLTIQICTVTLKSLLKLLE